MVGSVLGFDVCFDGTGGWSARDGAWARLFAGPTLGTREWLARGGGGGEVSESAPLPRGKAACEPWCAEPCADLNGDVQAECAACSSEWRCWPGAKEFARKDEL